MGKVGKKEVKKAESDEEPDSSEDDRPAKKAPANKSAFALMADSDEDESEEDEPKPKAKKEEKPKEKEKEKKKPKEEEPVAEEAVAAFGEKKKKKKDAEDDDAGDKEKKEKKEKKDVKDGEKKEKKKRPTPVIGEVLEVTPVPKKDKLRSCKVLVADGSEVVIVTNAPNVVVRGKFLVALPGITCANGVEVKVAKVGGVESSGMFCGPKEMGFEADVFDEHLAIQVADSAEVGARFPSEEECVQAFRDRQVAAAAAAAAQAASKEAAPSKDEGKKGKKGKKAGGAKEDEEDLDALLSEMGMKVEPAAEEPAKGKKAKAKAKGKAEPAHDDDFEAALAEVKEKEASKEEAAPEPAAAPVSKAADEDGEDEEDESKMDAKTLANKKKKEKKKLLEMKKKVGGEGLWGKDGAEEPAEKPEGGGDAAEAAVAEKKGAKGKAAPKGKPANAMIEAIRQKQEEERQLNEERAAFEAEQKRLIDEEEAKIKAEDVAQKAELERRRLARLAKIEKQKADGTYMSKTEKERKRRAEELRAMFGFSMDAGDDEEGEGGEGEGAKAKAAPKKKPLATKLKKKKQEDQPKEDESGSKANEVEEKEEKKEKPKSALVKALGEAKPKKKAKAVIEGAADADWEEVAEKIVGAEKGAEKEKDGSDSESGSGSGSGSDSDSDSSGSSSSSFVGYRSPIIVIMGHVDTGKTKLLDKIRKTNVQEGEAGGITQQIGATFFPDIALSEQTRKVDPDFEIEMPGLLIIDTPGHESFNNLRARGSSLCDMAILVIDLMHGLEPQTVESLEMLKKRRCPFIIALNKIDRCYQWQSKHYTAVKEALDRQEQCTTDEFEKLYSRIALQLNERGLNVALYWENEDPRSTVSIVPTSALTGEGVPDLLYCLMKSTQEQLSSKLERKEELQCTVIEVKNIEGLGTTIDVVLVNGILKEGDQIVIAGVNGPIVTTIRGLLTPQPMKEMRVKNDYVHHSSINQAMGVKIVAPGLEDAVAGCPLLVVGPDDDLEEMKDEVDGEFESILNNFEKQVAGVYVKASTLGSLEALLSFLQDMKIPVFDVGIGEVHKKDVKKAMIMKERKHPEYAVILAFDVAVNKEAKLIADKEDVQIMTADIIYHLQDKFKTYMDKIQEAKKVEVKQEAVFPAILQIDKQYVFHKNNPMIFGCNVMGGQLKIGTPICIPEKDNLFIGRVGSIEKDKKPVQIARRGDSVCVKIEQNTNQQHLTFGRHFDHTNQLYSQVTRESIDMLKLHFKDEMGKEDWELIIGLKKVFGIM